MMFCKIAWGDPFKNEKWLSAWDLSFLLAS